MITWATTHPFLAGLGLIICLVLGGSILSVVITFPIALYFRIRNRTYDGFFELWFMFSGLPIAFLCEFGVLLLLLLIVFGVGSLLFELIKSGVSAVLNTPVTSLAAVVGLLTAILGLIAAIKKIFGKQQK
jgi:hypothetical protein